MPSAAHQTSSYEQKGKQRAPAALRGRFEFSCEHLPSKLVGMLPNPAFLLRLAPSSKLPSVPRRNPLIC